MKIVELKPFFKDKVVLITGGTGSWGNELVTQLLESCDCKEIKIYSRGEQKQVEMKRKFSSNKKLVFIIGDVRDKSRLSTAMKGVDYVFHLAALKHVPICEENSWEAVQTNIIGTQNVIDAAIENDVLKVIDISTDKAVDPLNLYGTTKAVGEKLIIAANLINSKTKFLCIRGGNVLGTSGSVVPLFIEQIRKNNAITITDENMTRFFLTLKQAIHLVFQSVITAIGGETFVLKMPAAKITDLANVMMKNIGNTDTKKIIIGIRPGEKIHEILVSRYESPRTIDYGEYFVILPSIPINGINEAYDSKKRIDILEFDSRNTVQLDNNALEKMLSSEGWLDVNADSGFIRHLESEDLKFNNDKKWI